MPPLSSFIPKYKSSTATRLAPAKMAIFRSVITHPPPPHSTAPSPSPGASSSSPPSPTSPTPAGATATAEGGTGRRAVGRKQFLYSTAPRQLIPLTMSLENHRLWNPPAVDALGSRVVERDESGRLAKFASRFASPSLGASSSSSSSGEGKEGQGVEGKEGEERLFAPEADLSFLEGETLQSPAKGLGKRDIIGKSAPSKKGKK